MLRVHRPRGVLQGFKMVFLSDGTATLTCPTGAGAGYPRNSAEADAHRTGLGFGRVCSVEEVMEELKPSA